MFVDCHGFSCWDSELKSAECIGYISLVWSARIGVARVRMWRRSHVRSWIWQWVSSYRYCLWRIPCWARGVTHQPSFRWQNPSSLSWTMYYDRVPSEHFGCVSSSWVLWTWWRNDLLLFPHYLFCCVFRPDRSYRHRIFNPKGAVKAAIYEPLPEIISKNEGKGR